MIKTRLLLRLQSVTKIVRLVPSPLYSIMVANLPVHESRGGGILSNYKESNVFCRLSYENIVSLNYFVTDCLKIGKLR